MVQVNHSSRNRRRGIVLITTLIGLVLIIGLATLVQSVAISNVRTFRALAASHDSDTRNDSLRELARSKAAELIVGNPAKEFTAAVDITFEGEQYEIQVVRDGQRVSFSKPVLNRSKSTDQR